MSSPPGSRGSPAGQGTGVRYRTDNGADGAQHFTGRVGEFFPHWNRWIRDAKGALVNRIVYIVGAVVIIIALLSFFGLR